MTQSQTGSQDDPLAQAAERMRRAPSQARGKRRVAKILDASAELFAEVGFDGATTNAIAARAETSIGSLYQFFPNKEAILYALNARYLEELRVVCDRVLSPERAPQPLAQILDEVVDALSAFHARHPGFQAVFYGSRSTPELEDAAQAAALEITDRLDAIIALRRPDLEASRRKIVSWTAMDTMKAMLVLATRPVEPGWPQRVMAETKVLLLAYLEPTVGDAVSVAS